MAQGEPTNPAAIFDDHFAARQHGSRIPFDAEAFEHRVIDTHVVGLGADFEFGVRIPDDDIGVTARGQFALARIQTE